MYHRFVDDIPGCCETDIDQGFPCLSLSTTFKLSRDSGVPVASYHIRLLFRRIPDQYAGDVPFTACDGFPRVDSGISLLL